MDHTPGRVTAPQRCIHAASKQASMGLSGVPGTPDLGGVALERGANAGHDVVIHKGQDQDGQGVWERAPVRRRGRQQRGAEVAEGHGAQAQEGAHDGRHQRPVCLVQRWRRGGVAEAAAGRSKREVGQRQRQAAHQLHRLARLGDVSHKQRVVQQGIRGADCRRSHVAQRPPRHRAAMWAVGRRACVAARAWNTAGRSTWRRPGFKRRPSPEGHAPASAQLAQRC